MSDQTVIVAKPQRDRAAETALSRHMRVTRFREFKRVRRSRVAKDFRLVERELMPRYVFGATTDAHALGIALAEDHAAPKPAISGILGRTLDADLDPLRAIDGRETDPNAQAPIAKPKIGALVSLRSGPFQGWNVTVTALHGNAFSATACGKYPLRLPYTHLHPG